MFILKLKRGNFTTNILIDSIESFLYCLSSREHIVVRNKVIQSYEVL